MEFIARRFPQELLNLSESGLRDVLSRAAHAGISGGAVYDALVAATASEAGATLVTRDRRAIRIYEALGARFEFLS